MYLFTHNLVSVTSSRIIRKADRIDVLRNSGYPDIVIEWSKSLAPTAAQKYADLPAIILSRRLKKKGMKITHYDKNSEVRKAVQFAIDSDSQLSDTMKLVLDSVAWLVTNNMPLNFDLYNSSELELDEWAEEIHEYISRISVADPARYRGPVVYSFDDGWTINELTPDDCEIEGALMDHCVGGYYSDIETGVSRIFSLRDPHGFPHVTMEFNVDDPRKNVGETKLSLVQSKGRSNHTPKEEYVDKIREGLENLDVEVVDARKKSDLDIERFEYYYGWENMFERETYFEGDYGLNFEKPDDPFGWATWGTNSSDYNTILRLVNEEMNNKYGEEEHILYGATRYISEYHDMEECKNFLLDYVETKVPSNINSYRQKWVDKYMDLQEPIRAEFKTEGEFEEAMKRYKLALESAPDPATEDEISKAITAEKWLDMIESGRYINEQKYQVDPKKPWNPTKFEQNQSQMWLPFSASNYILFCKKS